MNVLVIFFSLVILFLSVVCGICSRCIKEQGELIESSRELIETQDKLIAAYRRNIEAKDKLISRLETEVALLIEEQRWRNSNEPRCNTLL